MQATARTPPSKAGSADRLASFRRHTSIHRYLRPLRCRQLDTSVLSCDTVGGGAYLAMCTFPSAEKNSTYIVAAWPQPTRRMASREIRPPLYGDVRQCTYVYVCTRRRRFYSARSKKFSFFFCVSQTKHFAFVTEKLRFLWLPFRILG